MRPTTARLALAATSVGCAVSGGVFFAFSTFVMPAIQDVPAAEGLPVMQAVNRFAETPPFMVALFAPAAATAYLAVLSRRNAPRDVATCVALGAGMYVLGAVIVTVAGNVPLNDAMAALGPRDVDTWRDAAQEWIALNHLRTLLTLGGAAALAVAATRTPSGGSTS